MLLCEGSTFFSGADIGEPAGPPREVEYRVLFNGFEALTFPWSRPCTARDGRRPRDRARLPLPRGRADQRFALPSHARRHSRRRRNPAPAAAHRCGACAGIHLSGRPVGTSQAKTWFPRRVIDGDVRAGAIGYARALLAAGEGPRRTGAIKVDSATATDESSSA